MPGNAVAERELKVGERSRLTGEPNVPLGKCVPSGVVSNLH
jgi:hypothetical protein